MKGKIRVFCRVRPMNQNELAMGGLPVVSLVDPYSLKIRVKKDADSYKEEEYAFDACYGDLNGQEEIFEDTKMLM
jgi:hypothetical protein